MQLHPIEVLEPRRLLAAVAWDGGGDGVSWFDPLNWSTDSLPGSADDVTVDVPGVPATRLSTGTITIRSLILREPLRIDNGGKLEVLTTAQSDLSVELDGGNMHGGAWTFGFAGAVVVGTANNSRLEFVASLTGDVLLNVEDAALLVVGDLALNGTIRLGGRNARLQFSGFNTLTSGTIRFESTLTSSFPEVSVTNGSLTLGSAASVTGAPEARGAFIGGHFVNRGLIDMTAGAQLYVTGVTILNEGQMRAIGSSSLVHVIAPTLFVNAAGATLTAASQGTFAVQGTDGGSANVNTRFWRNLGTIVVNDGVVYLGGTVRSDEVGTINRTGGVVRLNGVLDNVGRTFTLPAGVGPWSFDGGRVVGGTVNMSLSGTSSANRLVGPLVFNGNLNLDYLTVEGGVDLNGTAVIDDELTLEGSQTISGGTWRFNNPTFFPPGNEPTLHIAGNATVTLGPDVLVEAGYVYLGRRSSGSGAGTLTNEGVIELSPTVHPLLQSRINPGNALVNAGTVRVLDGASAIIQPAGSGLLNQGLIRVGTADNQTKLAIQGLFSNAGVLDVNALVEVSPPSAGLLAAIADQTAAGYNGGAWDGQGIRSSRAAGTAATNDGVGYFSINTVPPVIRGRYTRLGDADANGGVTLADFNLLAAGFGTTGNARWDQGDFNYDRVVNLADFNILAANFGGTIFAASATSSARATDQVDHVRRLVDEVV